MKLITDYSIFATCITILTYTVYGVIVTYSLNTKAERFIKNLQRGL